MSVIIWEQITETCDGYKPALEEVALELYPLSAIPRKLFIRGC